MAKGERCKNEENSPDLDQYAKDALDELFSKEQQTYEEFLEGFTFLKKEDITGFKAHSSNSYTKDGASCQEDEKDIATVGSPLSPESHLTEDDSIPEEVLGPGSSTASILMRTAESSGASAPQVDNFVDCEDEASEGEESEQSTQVLDPLLEDNFVLPSYLPSLSSNPCTTKGTEIQGKSTQGSNVKADLDGESLETKDICYLSEGALNLPGEVHDQELEEEEDSSSKVVIKPHLRQLQISTRINDSSGDDDNNLNVEGEDTDEVQPFILDTDFDYDNVALTPKFSFIPKHIVKS